MGEDLFLQVEQIIPLPETEEFMIDAKEKQKEESDKSKTVEQSEARLIKFWSQLKIELKKHQFDQLERDINLKAYIKDVCILADSKPSNYLLIEILRMLIRQ